MAWRKDQQNISQYRFWLPCRWASTRESDVKPMDFLDASAGIALPEALKLSRRHRATKPSPFRNDDGGWVTRAGADHVLGQLRDLGFATHIHWCFDVLDQYSFMMKWPFIVKKNAFHVTPTHTPGPDPLPHMGPRSKPRPTWSVRIP